MTVAAAITARNLELLRCVLRRVLGTPGVEGGGRLCAFLSFVIDEEIGNRGDDILGKTVAHDVYGRRSGDTGDPEYMVRVDTQRLRRRLENYYANSGAKDSVTISRKRPDFRALGE